MSAPGIPSQLVELGRAVELDSTNWVWAWTKKDGFVVASSKDGKRLYIFKKPKRQAPQGERYSINKSLSLFKRFNCRDSDQLHKGDVEDRIKRAGNCVHIIYNSDKFGRRENYIHTFTTQPEVWVDKTNNPKMIVLRGGKTRITRRGIEG